MSASYQTTDPIETEWLTAIVEAEQARKDYDALLQSPRRDEGELNRSWLCLWRAERRRDELFRLLK
jgi:hypothetical protein